MRKARLETNQGDQPIGSRTISSRNDHSEHDDFIILGHISGVYGVKGWLKVYSYADPMESIVEYSPWYIRPGRLKPGRLKSGHIKDNANTDLNSGWQAVKLKSGKRHAKTVIARLEACNDRNAAQLYVGYEIAILSSQLKSLDHSDEFYWRDLMGLQVVNLQGDNLGEVTNFIETGANDVLVVTGKKLNSNEEQPSETQDESKPREILIPWAFGQTVVSVNLQASLIEVDWQDDWNE